jgi:4-hydroxybenzoyl-CoA reductase subunit beta
MLRLKTFDVKSPETLAEAASILAGDENAAIIAGGTDLVPKMKRGQIEPKVLVSLARIVELNNVENAPGRLSLGSGVTLRSLETLDDLTPFTAVREAVRQVATPIIRNSATLGGNLLQDTRCRYYDRSLFWRDAVGFCMKKDGDECRVAPGSGRCFASFCSDVAPAMAVLDAKVRVVGEKDEIVPLEAIYLDDGIEYADMRRRILAGVILEDHGYASTYLKLRMRGSFDFPEVGVAVAVREQGAQVTANVALTGIGSCIYVLKEELPRDGIPDLIERVFKTIKPVDTMYFSPAYRKKMAKRLLVKAFNELLPSG